jgi:hypothetical protein
MKRAALLGFVLFLGAALSPSCVTYGRTQVAVPVHGAGTGVRSFTVGDFVITLESARIAWGPAYFCTTPFADVDLCPTALAEVRSAATIDALDETPQLIGELRGISGTVRSAMFDYGITWLLPSASAAPDPGAVDGQHSAHFAGSAEQGGVTTRFVLDVDMVPRNSGVSAAHGVPTMHTLSEAADALVVRFDPSAIFADADFSQLDAMGADPVVVDESSEIYQAVVIAFSSSALPALEWARP